MEMMFPTLKEAENFYDANNGRSIVGSDHMGWFVYFGKDDRQRDMFGLCCQYDQKASAKRLADYEKKQMCEARVRVGREIADERGLSGYDHDVFVLGFCGYDAKFLHPNPAQCGKSFIYYEGKAIYKDKEVQRRIRVSCAENHKSLPAPYRSIE